MRMRVCMKPDIVGSCNGQIIDEMECKQGDCPGKIFRFLISANTNPLPLSQPPTPPAPPPKYKT